nr:MAG: Zn-dependent alcohol dehydrogenase [Candidatus Nanosalinarum sp. J07AB56]
MDIEASGVCHSDVFTVEQQRPEVELPTIPGHEAVGEIVETGKDVEAWSEGDRVGIGWHGGYCGDCESCRRGNFNMCRNGEISGVTRDGGHAEYMTARSEALANVPSELDSEDAAPMMCAGVTTFNALRHTDARPGDTVAVVGVGGLGHLGVQYASESGFETVAVSTSNDKRELAKELGADHFIDSSNGNVAQQLREIGGADVALVTAPAAEAVEQVIPGLGTDGEVTVVGVPGSPVETSVGQLIASRGSVSGWPSGHAKDSEDTMDFGVLRDVHTMTETYSLDQYEQAYQSMMENEARFRAVVLP